MPYFFSVLIGKNWPPVHHAEGTCGCGGPTSQTPVAHQMPCHKISNFIHVQCICFQAFTNLLSDNLSLPLK